MSGPDQKEIDINKVACLLNIAACNIAMKDYGQAIRNSTEAVELDPLNVKALLRRAKAYIGRREYQVIFFMCRRSPDWVFSCRSDSLLADAPGSAWTLLTRSVTLGRWWGFSGLSIFSRATNHGCFFVFKTFSRGFVRTWNLCRTMLNFSSWDNAPISIIWWTLK